jgi:non-specific serine/threonine protein kinase/serine/threonine-protein kinase
LGVVLYELLVGALPLDFKKLADHEVLRQLREQDVPRPSTRALAPGPDSLTAAQNRGTDPPSLTRQLRGDADAITLKALEKDRSRRYASPSELGADIGRFLRNEPVIAHQPSTGYRAAKYIRRHQLGVALAAAGVLLLTGFAVVQAVQLRRITRERDRADRITQFMTDMFNVSNPSESRGSTVTAREILDKASKEIRTGLSSDPQLQAKMMYTMAVTYRHLGLYSRAQSLLEDAVATQQRVLGPRDPDTLRSMSELARVLALAGRFPEAEKLNRETLDIQNRVLGPEHPDTLLTAHGLASDVGAEGHFAEAEKMYREILDKQRRVLGPEHVETLSTETGLAVALGNKGDFAEEEKLERETLDSELRVFGPEDPTTLTAMSNLASTLAEEGHYAEAEKMYRATIDTQRRIFGPEHPRTLDTMFDLAVTLTKEGRYPEAEKMARQTLDAQRRVLGPEHRSTLRSMSALTDILTQEGHYGEAEKLYEETLDIQRRVLGPEHPETLLTLEAEAVDLSRDGQYGSAEKLFRESIRTASKATEPKVLALAWYNFACGAALTGHRNEALDYLGNAIDHGYRVPDSIAADSDLKSLHGDPRFDALLTHARQTLAAKPQ